VASDGLMRRQRIVLIAVLVLGVIALGLWAMLADRAVDPPPAAPVVQVEPAPVPAISPAVAETLPAVEEKAKLPAGAILRGRVIDAATAEPVRKFTLHFHWDRSTGYREAPPARTFDTDDGRFEWEDATPGVWAIIGSARGYQRFELEGVRLRPGETTPEIVMPLRPGHAVKGRVYDEASGVGIAAASVNFRESQVDRFAANWRIRDSFAVRSEKSGSFVLEGVPSGRITISAGVGGYAGREVEIVVGDETAPVEIPLFVGGSISGRLTAADGVTALAGSAGLFRLDERFGSSSRTTQSGEFSYQHLPAGRYKITGQAAGMTTEREITLAANERIEGIVLALGAGHSIRGVVTGLRPEALERVNMGWDNRGDGGGPPAPIRVDARGAYELRGVPPGRVNLWAEVHNSRRLSRTVEMPRDRDLTVNFEFPSGVRLSGRVTHRGKPVVGAMVNPRQPRTGGELSIHGATTTQQGDYVIEDLPPGEYFLRIANYRSRLIQVSDDMVFDMDVPSAQLSGQVLEAGGKVPVIGAEVVIWWAEDPARIRQFAITDNFGRFVIVGLEPGEFVLSAHKSGYELYREPFSFGAPVADMTIRLSQAKGVEARVRDAISGKPLRSMNLHAVETIRGRHGISFNVTLDENGVFYVPSGLAGSTLSFGADGYAVAKVHDWSGDELRLKFTPQ
jgi:hypothetical protein